MKKTMKMIFIFCLALTLLAGMSGGIAAATAESVWVNGVQLNNNAYLSRNSVAEVSGFSATEPVSYRAWFHDGTLALNGAQFVNNTNVQINDKTGSCGLYAEGDLTVVLKEESYIGTEYGTWGVYVKDGNLEFSAAGTGMLRLSATYAGIFVSDHDVIFSGYANVSTSIKGNESDPVSGISVVNGDVLIKDHAIVYSSVDREAAAENAAALRLSGGSLSIIDRGTLQACCNKYPSEGTSYGILATRGSGNGGEVTISDVATINVSLGCVGISASQSVTLNASAKASIDVNTCGIDTPALTVNRAFLDVCASGSGGKPFKETTLLTLDQSYLTAARISADTYIYDPEELEAIEYDANRDVFAYGGNRVRGFVFYPAYEGDQYIDCSDWGWATPYNYFVIENKIMGSVYSGSKYFENNGSVTRGMMVTVLYRLAGSPALTESDYAAYNEKFSDVAKGQWYYDAVVWANKNNVTTGVTDTFFAPNGKVTREQLVTFFFRFGYLYHDDPDVGATLSKYKDLDQIASYALPAFRWAYGHGIVNGTSSTTLSPKATCTRGQMAKIITVFSGVYLGDRDWITIAGQ